MNGRCRNPPYLAAACAVLTKPHAVVRLLEPRRRRVETGTGTYRCGADPREAPEWCYKGKSV
jgi:hypothetical protein